MVGRPAGDDARPPFRGTGYSRSAILGASRLK